MLTPSMSRRALIAVSARAAQAPRPASVFTLGFPSGPDHPDSRQPSTRPGSAGSRRSAQLASEQGLEAEIDHVMEDPDALADLVPSDLDQPLGTEILDRERGHGGAAGQRLTQGIPAGVPAAGEPAQEAAGEGIAGAGRVAQGLDREGRRLVTRLAVAVERAVLPLLDDDRLGALIEQPVGGARQQG